ncbi:hypothetical protein F9L07_28480 [Pimelobacter simplex]|uniref:Uncharacterized protein n=1 Tax=Nocardioides simplex TaxID=2045 RepID=A0A7J5DQL9_NOCSI|nr:hypothetical protein [Pimelobacter simplex]KAB2806972.1 hypothetical protein F9L07_28480 [Pimelobacter simplex]
MSARHEEAVGDARKRGAFGTAEAPEFSGRLEGAPGDGSEALVAGRADLVDVILSARWPDGDTSGFPSRRVADRIADAVLASSWFAAHDRQTAERAWEEGAQAEYDLDRGHIDDFNNPYSEEAHRG